MSPFPLWRKLLDSIDPNFDLTDLPLLNVPAPEGLPAGVTPEAVKDPQLRAQYEARIRRNAQKARRFAVQIDARQLLEMFPLLAGRYFAALYSVPKANPAELDGLLERYRIPDAQREEIMHLVQQARQRKAQAP